MATDPEQDLEARLERLGQALRRSRADATPDGGPLARPPAKGRSGAAAATLAASALLVTMAIVTGHFWLLAPATLFLVASGVLFMKRMGEALLSSVPAGLGPKDPTRAHVGVGATVAADAVVEPGAVVEMGATVGRGAHVKSGAVVRMGATVGANVVLERGAVVSWGATVRHDARLGEGATLGAGGTVNVGAEVPANTYVMPGGTYAAGSKTASAKTNPALTADPRDARVDAACDRLDAELRDSSEQVKAHLGASAETVSALRRTCHDLLRRERALRGESSAEAVARLDDERKVIETRLASETDDVIRRSLTGAVKAIADQRRQRELLGRSADRLEAEQTRLVWTLEGLATQLVRLRTAGVEAGEAANTELARGVQQLHDEIEAIAQALDDVAADDRRSIAALAEAPATFDERPADASDERARERE